jgi:8-oxo-dGTP pyrophosphatase MutT (NUDIX family)
VTPEPFGPSDPGAPRRLVAADLTPSEVGARLVATLEAHVPADDHQAELRDRMVAFARAHADALQRTCPEGHFTGSALVVDPARREVLVLFHTKLRRWLQPGGHADGVANLAVTARREATEETGIAGLEVVGPAVDLDIHEVRPPRERPHLHLDVRHLVLAPEGARAVGNHESEALRWVAPDELDALGADEGLRRLARRGLDQLDRL